MHHEAWTNRDTRVSELTEVDAGCTGKLFHPTQKILDMSEKETKNNEVANIFQSYFLQTK